MQIKIDNSVLYNMKNNFKEEFQLKYLFKAEINCESKKMNKKILFLTRYKLLKSCKILFLNIRIFGIPRKMTLPEYHMTQHTRQLLFLKAVWQLNFSYNMNHGSIRQMLLGKI